MIFLFEDNDAHLTSHNEVIIFKSTNVSEYYSATSLQFRRDVTKKKVGRVTYIPHNLHFTYKENISPQL